MPLPSSKHANKPYQAFTMVNANKALGYFESLSKHFARKVPVVIDQYQADIEFSMGQCQICYREKQLSFLCQADTEEALEIIKEIIRSHVVRYGELKSVELIWQAYGK